MSKYNDLFNSCEMFFKYAQELDDKPKYYDLSNKILSETFGYVGSATYKGNEHKLPPNKPSEVEPNLNYTRYIPSKIDGGTFKKRSELKYEFAYLLEDILDNIPNINLSINPLFKNHTFELLCNNEVFDEYYYHNLESSKQSGINLIKRDLIKFLFENKIVEKLSNILSKLNWNMQVNTFYGIRIDSITHITKICNSYDSEIEKIYNKMTNL